MEETKSSFAKVIIPSELLPRDGRFGSGPSKIRPAAVDALHDHATAYLGTSHRQAGVREKVGRLKSGFEELFGLPDGYEVIIGNGGATTFWDAMAFALVKQRSRHFVFGEFSSKCASAIQLAPHLDEPEVVESPPGSHPALEPSDGVDLYALTQNETSTGVAMPVERLDEVALVAVDATSAAGGMLIEPSSFDVYYFSPQKCFAADGGLWIAILAPAAIDRIFQISSSNRYVPPSLDLSIAIANSRKDQTYNTPGLASLFLMVEQVEWMLKGGGLQWAAGRSRRSSDHLYDWAQRSSFARPFVGDPSQRSPVVVTIDFDDSVQAAEISRVLRANGVVDTEPYRKLGRNQLRIATYPAIDLEDIQLLTHSIDYVVEVLGDS
jgi:phosphoserine aminotransferase